MVREDILQRFPELFGKKRVNGREVDVEQTIATLTRELRPEIARRADRAPQHPRRRRSRCARSTRGRAGRRRFDDPVGGKPWTFRQIVQGLVDNFLGRDTERRWRLNDEVADPRRTSTRRGTPGLELTGPWHPLDMAFNALNSPAPMNMPDFEDASPPHFQPDGTPSNEPVGIFAALQNAKEIREGRWNGRPYEVLKKGKTREYRINEAARAVADAVRAAAEHPPPVRPRARWTASPPPGSSSSRRSGRSTTTTRSRAPAAASTSTSRSSRRRARRSSSRSSSSRLEGLMGVRAGTVKIKMLYEEGNAGRYLPGDRLDAPASAARHERRPLGLPRQHHRDVEGRSAGRLPGPADGRDGDAEHDRLPALRRAAHADGGDEGRRAHATRRRSAAWPR